MACPGGCINGGGQPFAMREQKVKRSDNLYAIDRLSSVRRAEENPLIENIYKDIIGDRAHELLHVHYHAKKK